MQLLEPVVERDVEGNRHADGADEVERAPDEHEREWRSSHGDQGPPSQPETGGGRPEERRHEGGGDGHDVDRLHSRDALRRRQPLERGHHETGEGEEDPGYQPAPEGGGQRRSVQDAAHRLSSQTPVEAASRAYSAKSLGSRPRARWTPSVRWALRPSRTSPNR